VSIAIGRSIGAAPGRITEARIIGLINVDD
jgi:hypothetical protein